jgi:hypothetical protein
VTTAPSELEWHEQVRAALDFKIDNADFFLWIVVEADPGATLDEHELRRDVEAWLNGHDPDHVFQTRHQPEHAWDRAGLVVRFTAIPKKPEARGSSGPIVGNPTPPAAHWAGPMIAVPALNADPPPRVRLHEQVRAALDFQIDNPNFLLAIVVEADSSAPIDEDALRRDVEAWLGGLDHERVLEAQDEPEHTWESAGLVVRFTAIPKKPDACGTSGPIVENPTPPAAYWSGVMVAAPVLNPDPTRASVREVTDTTRSGRRPGAQAREHAATRLSGPRCQSGPCRCWARVRRAGSSVLRAPPSGRLVQQ